MNSTYTTTDIKTKPLNWQQPLYYPISPEHLSELARHNPEDAAVLFRKIRPSQAREPTLDLMEDRR